MGDVDRKIDAATEAGGRALERVRAMPGSDDKAIAANRLSRELRDVSEEAAGVLHAEVIRIFDTEGLSYGQVAKRAGISKALAFQIIKARNKTVAEKERDEKPVTEPSTTPEPVPVVTAIVTSERGVLISRRNDGKPKWAFIGGEIEPGEAPADAAIREVKEETGLQIRAGGVIGRRVHPKTGRTLVYMAAYTTHGTDAFVGDTDELAEVRWVDPEEADALTGGTIFEPVRQHLRNTLGGNGS